MTYKWYKMKKYILLFLVTFQMVFSQEIVVKGKAFNSKEHEHRGVNIVVNDTINRLMDYNLSLYSKFEKKSKFQNSEDDLYLQYEKNRFVTCLFAGFDSQHSRDQDETQGA